jgi:N-acetylmuramoyl-L-alanine amidase
VRVSSSGGYEDIRARTDNGVVFVSLSELVDQIGGTLDWITIGHEVRYEIGRSRFSLFIGSPYFRLDDSLFNMTYPMSFDDGQVFVPAAMFLPFLDRVSGQKLTWDPGSATIRIESDYFNVTDLSVMSKANGLLIEIYISTSLNYELFISEGNTVNVSIRNARVNQTRIQSRRDSRYMYWLKAHQIENNTGQISFRLKRQTETVTHKLVANPPRIQISIIDADFEIDTSPKPPVAVDDKIDVIVIDPGHGGQDYGAVGQYGTREKEVVLDIAKALAKLIRKDKQFKVIMTRDRDKYVSLDQRAKIANDAGADLFISIHANASPKKHVKGWNVFFLAPAKNDSARSVAQFENSFFLRELAEAAETDEDSADPFADDPLFGILNEMIMTEFQVESHDFAIMVARELRRRLDIPARGVDQAGFFVLNKVFTPSVLIESAFISNRNEEKLLKSRNFRRDLAKSLYDAIKRFKGKYERLAANN